MRPSRCLALTLGVAALLGGSPERVDAGGVDLPPVQALAVGDFNGDGVPDLAVGLPEVGSGKLRKAGEVRAFSGKKGTLLFRLPGRQREEEYADAMAAIGDVDGDGATDLAVGAAVRSEMIAASPLT